MMRLDREAYQKLIEEDILWLRSHGESLERRHVETVLRESVKFMYCEDCSKINAPSSAIAAITEPGEQVHCDTFEEQCKIVESQR